MADLPSSRDSDTSEKFPIWQKLAAAVIGATTLIGAISLFLDKVPDLITNSRKAYTAVYGMFPHSPANQSMAPHETSVVSETPIDAPSQPTTTELGPAPGPSCHMITSTDFSTFPPRYNRSWSC